MLAFLQPKATFMRAVLRIRAQPYGHSLKGFSDNFITILFQCGAVMTSLTTSQSETTWSAACVWDC